VVLRAPICPGMRLPLMMRDGSVPGAIDPACGDACCRASRPAVEVVAVDDALEAAALRDAAHFHAIAFCEDGNGDGAAGGRRFPGHVKAPDHARRRLDAALLRVARERFGGVLGFFAPKPSSTRPSSTAMTGHGPGLDHGHRHMRAGRVEDPGHSQFSTDQSVHVSLLDFDFHVDAGRQIQFRQRVHRLRP